MDNKLVFRATAAYHQFLVDMAQKNQASKNLPYHISKIKSLMHEISIWTRRLKIVEAKKWESAIHFLKNSMIPGLMVKVTNNFAVMESELLEKNEICVPSMKELWEEIKSVNGLFDDCKYQNHCLSVVTKPITLEHDGVTIKFGRFRIILDLKTPSNSSNGSYDKLVNIEALEPNYPPAEEGLIHPHVREDSPCLGEAVGLMQAPLMRGQIESVFLILNSMLKTYNPTSPFRTMEEWYEEDGCTCEGCNENVHEDEIYCCISCETYHCDQCIRYCSNCQEHYCGNCMGFMCGWCEENVCDGCERHECKGCGMDLCVSCLTGCCHTYCEDCSPKCESCHITFCPECEGGECTECNNNYCESCLLACKECGNDTCNDCGNECAKCDDLICSECTIECNNCNKNYCKECIDEEECSLLKEKV